ncbi:lamin tail domain-containing protein, partial [Candidatus Saccharibacteria bacterium]|nr:lamin tail domain-containing protein [Candidatus Saccharibacteria bacterium]
ADEVDRVGWGSTAVKPETAPALPSPAGSLISRDISLTNPDTDNNSIDFTSASLVSPLTMSLYEVAVPVDLCPNIDGLQDIFPEGYLQDVVGDCYFDVCQNIDQLQVSVPTGYVLDGFDCVEVPLEDKIIFITELLPNAPGNDTGLEYIELYNPNDENVILTGYQLQLGPSFTKTFTIDDRVITPHQYLAFSDSETGFVLPNASGVELRLIAPAGNTVSNSPAYQNAQDDVSWALVEDVWIYTNQITRGSANKPYLQPAIEEIAGVTSVLAPCPAGKYRNPATNRCRTIETAVSQLAPCDEDEFRNPETNRCKKVSSSGSTLTPCEPGYERNPETNRCRKVSTLGVSSEADLLDVKDVAVESAGGQLNWPVLTATFIATAGYMVYEWRNELRLKYLSFKNR